MTEWKDCEIELPPCDGIYQVTDYANNPYDLGTCSYDGYGFCQGGIYYKPKYWRKFDGVEKKYGKQK